MSKNERAPITYESPLVTRYASSDMVSIFSPRTRSFLWRDLWIALAEGESKLGLTVTEEQIAELRRKRDDLDDSEVARYEKETRHEVIAHIRHWGDLCPTARPIIHLGATSAFVMDNGDILQMREGLRLVTRRVVELLRTGRDVALKYRDLACLGYTHLQPAQPTTLGKRVAMWLQDFLSDLEQAEAVLSGLRFRGVKGATGTQASFLRLFDGDHARVLELDRLVSEAFGFSRAYRVTGQTYPRKLDSTVLGVLAGLAQSAHKMSNDIRFLQTMGEAEEPFEENQVGSSAMAYKRNPMRSERIAGLSRMLLTLAPNAGWNAANQWMERTLDDSANRRLAISECFLLADSILILCQNVLGGLRACPAIIGRRLQEQAPLLATEDILMAGVARGADRQDLHERIRRHAMESVRRMREEGATASDLLDRIAGDGAFSPVKDELARILDPRRLVGRAPEQVDEFLAEELDPAVARHPLGPHAESVRV